jgi:hypothetical protein
VQGKPPLAGVGFVHVRVCVPSMQALQSLQPPSIGQACVLQACDEAPLQDKPPLAGTGLLQLRV